MIWPEALSCELDPSVMCCNNRYSDVRLFIQYLRSVRIDLWDHLARRFSTSKSGSPQIPVSKDDQEKTTFTYPFGTYAYRRMPFGLCNAPATFQRCMTAIFCDFCVKIVEVFMDDFSVYGTSFDDYLSKLDLVLQRCE